MQSFHPIWHHYNRNDIYWMDMERVIGAALAGDQRAIAKLYNAYSHKALGICYNIEGKRANILTDLQSIEPTLQLIEWVK